MKVNNIPGFITVRTSSSRLPNKCFLPFGEKCNVLEHIIRRTKYYNIDPIICTSTDPSDDPIEKLAIKEGVKYFRGSLINKLQRWADCATEFNLEAFHTVDADDPFFDGDEIRRSFNLLLTENLDLVSPTIESSAGNASVGYSIKTDTVTRSLKGLESNTDTEMMWFYLDKLENLKKKVLPSISNNNLKLRLTLDYVEDYWLLESTRRLVGNLASREDIETLFLKNPDLYKINWFRNTEWKLAQNSKKI
jgi:spore coat polysaccharide biosynthesis protein SpsF|tara:strand:- start:98 stop:844 length:747 start_codon:yes stop_codon:yes gene_type:complete